VFRYAVCFYVLDLDELDELERRLPAFSARRPSLLALRARDHLGDPALPVKENVLGWLAERGLDLRGGRILLLTNLAVLGYVFNPVSFFYCYRPDGELACVVAEVSNTFGERWPYLLADCERLEGQGLVYATAKRLHVSPFFGLEQEYRFALSEPGDTVFARIDVHEDGRRPLGAVLAGRRRELSAASVTGALVTYPLMPVKVIAAIHWEALKLRLKGVPFHHKPPFDPARGSLGPPADGGRRETAGRDPREKARA
jgi:DUF1365 family protein